MEAMESGKRYWAKVVGVMRGVMREQTDMDRCRGLAWTGRMGQD